MSRTRRIATIVILGMVGALLGVTTATAGGGGHCEPTERAGVLVELEGACFLPSTLHVEAGRTITFVNEDPFAHNVSGTGWGHYEDMGQGDRFATTFADVGIYPFACTLHPGMNGAIVVGDVGGTGGSTEDVQPLATSTAPQAGDDGWIVWGTLGLLIGGIAGAGLATMRRRTARA